MIQFYIPWEGVTLSDQVNNFSNLQLYYADEIDLLSMK
jgi:hypothetical protein